VPSPAEAGNGSNGCTFVRVSNRKPIRGFESQRFAAGRASEPEYVQLVDLFGQTHFTQCFFFTHADEWQLMVSIISKSVVRLAQMQCKSMQSEAAIGARRTGIRRSKQINYVICWDDSVPSHTRVTCFSFRTIEWLFLMIVTEKWMQKPDWRASLTQLDPFNSWESTIHFLATGVESTEKNIFNVNITHQGQFTNSFSIEVSTTIHPKLKSGVPILA
jgi:hypothetical protein